MLPKEAVVLDVATTERHAIAARLAFHTVRRHAVESIDQGPYAGHLGALGESQ